MSLDDTIQLKYNLNFLDGIHFIFFTIPRSRLYRIIFALFLIFTGVVMSQSVFKPTRSFLENLFVFFIAMFLIVGLLGVVILLLNIVFLLFNRQFYTPKKLTLSQTGILSSAPGIKSELDWVVLKKIKQTRRHIFLFVNDNCAFIIPINCFDNLAEAKEFYNFANTHLTQG